MRTFLRALALLPVVLLFQNCGIASQHNSDGSSNIAFKGCDAELQAVYYETYYKTFRSSCTACHDSGGEAGRPFASADFDVAYKTFMSLSRYKVEGKAQDAGHRGPRTGPQHTPMIQAAQARWQAAEAKAVECMPSDAIKTPGKSAAAVYGNSNPWTKLTWRLSTELTGLATPIMLDVALEYRRYRLNNVDMGYEFRNPTADPLDDGNATTPIPAYRLRGLTISLNGVELPGFTFFATMDRTIGGPNFPNVNPLAPGAGHSYALTAVSSTDKIGMIFKSIIVAAPPQLPEEPTNPNPEPNPNIPARVTYADLMSSNALLGVFNANCRSCHNATQMSGSLDLTNFAAASARAQRIVDRMNNPAQPMPPSGLLGNDPVTVVERWLSSGAPEN